MQELFFAGLHITHSLFIHISLYLPSFSLLRRLEVYCRSSACWKSLVLMIGCSHGLLMSGFRLISRSTAVAQILGCSSHQMSNDLLSLWKKKNCRHHLLLAKKHLFPILKSYANLYSLIKWQTLISAKRQLPADDKAPLTATMLTSLCSSWILHKLVLISPWTRPRFWWKCVKSKSRPVLQEPSSEPWDTNTCTSFRPLFCGCV